MNASTLKGAQTKYGDGSAHRFIPLELELRPARQKLIQLFDSGEMGMADQTKISVYLDDGRVFDYLVSTPDKAREHSAAIVLGGYRHTDNASGSLEHYPPHRIVKVKCTGGVTTMYPDEVRGT